MLTLSTYSGLDPRLKRIFDEISFKSINTKSLPFYFNVSGGKLGINTNAPRMPLDVVGDAWIDGRLQTTTLSVLGHLQALAGDFNGLVSTPDLGVTRRATLNNPEFYGAVKSDTLDFNLGAWRSWTPSYTGFSTAPSEGVSKFVRLGNTVVAWLVPATNGTSNATTFTVTLPFSPNTSAGGQFLGPINVVDNGSYQSSLGMVRARNPVSTTVDLYINGAAGAWTGTGGKNAHFMLIYEVA